MFFPLGSRLRVTRRGCLLTGGVGNCSTVLSLVETESAESAAGDLIDNHRIFLNMEVTFCMKLLLLPVDDFRLPLPLFGAPNETMVGFLSSKRALV